MKNFKYIVFSTLTIAFIALVFSGCSKTPQTRTVTYQISSSSQGFFVNYRNDENELVKDTIVPQSAQDVWRMTYQAMPGQIVFVSAWYKNLSDAIDVRILIDGKAFRQGKSTNDTVSYVTLSGTVPEI